MIESPTPPTTSPSPPAETARHRRRLHDPRVTVVVPALNEAENIAEVIAQLPDDVDELILVDGHSVDDTVEVAMAVWPHIRVLRQSHDGKGDALAAGTAIATGDIIVMIDADGSTDPAEIPRFVDALTAGADFAKGSRFLPGGGSEDLSAVRRFGDRMLTRLVNLLFRTRYTDLCYGYNAFWRDVSDRIPIRTMGFEVETLMDIEAAKAGLVVREVPSFERSRLHGQSHLHAVRDGLRVLATIIRERLRR